MDNVVPDGILIISRPRVNTFPDFFEFFEKILLFVLFFGAKMANILDYIVFIGLSIGSSTYDS
jgi:hypothetical protein